MDTMPLGTMPLGTMPLYSLNSQLDLWFVMSVVIAG